VDFLIVWLCDEEEYAHGQESGEVVRSVPGPLEAVKELEPS
jgi:hypothetical protein